MPRVFVPEREHLGFFVCVPFGQNISEPRFPIRAPYKQYVAANRSSPKKREIKSMLFLNSSFPGCIFWVSI